MNGNNQNTDQEKIAANWDDRTKFPKPYHSYWWESPLINRHINKLVYGIPFNKSSEGVINFIKERTDSRIFERGLSVGCGIGNKEMTLIQEGMIRTFELFELSPVRIAKGRELAKKLGLEDKVSFNQENPFKSITTESFDFVHWNASLHHMMNVDEAVKWSYHVLKPNGMFYMCDYVGPTRFQWSDEALELAKRIRSLLPERYLRNPLYPNTGPEFFSRILKRPSANRWKKKDPSEAADSERILECVKRYFPDAEITLTGGIVYHMILSNILYNFDEENENDKALLNLLMLIDELCIRIPGLENHYATAFAWKH